MCTLTWVYCLNCNFKLSSPLSQFFLFYFFPHKPSIPLSVYGWFLRKFHKMCLLSLLGINCFIRFIFSLSSLNYFLLFKFSHYKMIHLRFQALENTDLTNNNNDYIFQNMTKNKTLFCQKNVIAFHQVKHYFENNLTETVILFSI